MKRFFLISVAIMGLWFRTGAVAAIYDGKLDLVWRHAITGQNAVWFMDNISLDGGVEIQANSDLGWWIGGTGDVNDDGNLDLIWTKAGYENAVWYMDGIQNLGYDSLPVAAEFGWRIVGSGDFNADGYSDILLRHDSTGQNAIWLMFGVWIQSGHLLPQVSDLNWRIGGTGDFNRDGKSDILWRHMGYGWNAVWYMDGGTYQWAEYFTTQPDMGWELVGSGDFNEDNYQDLVWRNPSRTSEANAIWFMQGSYKMSEVLLPDVANGETGWRIVGMGDFGIYTPPPLVSDQDYDGLRDAWELEYFGNLGQNGDGDPDHDGVTNAEERGNGTNPNSRDTDGDGVSDATEIANHTNPTNPSDKTPQPSEDLVRAMMSIVSCVEPYYDFSSQTYELNVGNFFVENPQFNGNGGSYAERSVYLVEGQSYQISVANTGVQFGNPPTPENRWYGASVQIAQEDIWGTQLVRPVLPENQWFGDRFFECPPLDRPFQEGPTRQGWIPWGLSNRPGVGPRYEDAQGKTATLALAKARIWIDGLPERQNENPGIYLGVGNTPLIPIRFEVKNADLNPEATVIIGVALPDTGGGGHVKLYADAAKTQCVVDLIQNCQVEYTVVTMPSILYLEGVSAGIGHVYLKAGDGFDMTGKEKRILFNVIQTAIAVDNNRDGSLSFDLDDQTSPAHPFTFWVNEDDDGTPIDEDDQVGSSRRDYEDMTILSRRDLEDFERLHINIDGPTDAIKNGQILVGLRWKNTVGTPAINIYRAVETDGATKYLTDLTVAGRQVPALAYCRSIPNRDGNYASVDTRTTFIFKPSFWSGLSASGGKNYLLFEGAGTGFGRLDIVLVKPNGIEIHVAEGVWIKLNNVKSMYQRVKVKPRDPGGIPAPFLSGTTFDVNNSGTEPADDGYPFIASTDEAKSALVFVHGSNISYETAMSNAETMYKRLYWQGYQGRLVLFYWDTLVGSWDGSLPAHYNLNEYRALKYGWALKNYVEGNLPANYVHNVVGHSLGAGVIVSALQKRIAENGSTIPGMTARNVILMQAAMPASCFDPNAATLDQLVALENPQSTPDFSEQLGYRGLIASSVNATLFNVHNRDDWVLGLWINNQMNTKPDGPRVGVLPPPYLFKTQYTWSITGGGQLWDFSNISIGPIRLRFVEDRCESMAFIARSRTEPAGRTAVNGIIGASANACVGVGSSILSDPFRDSRADHSGEFRRCIQQLVPLYRYIFERVR